MLNGFRERRLILGLTRQEMAKKIGVTPITITMWEKGENLPRRGVRERVAAVYGATVTELAAVKEFEREESPCG